MYKDSRTVSETCPQHLRAGTLQKSMNHTSGSTEKISLREAGTSSKLRLASQQFPCNVSSSDFSKSTGQTPRTCISAHEQIEYVLCLEAALAQASFDAAKGCVAAQQADLMFFRDPETGLILER